MLGGQKWGCLAEPRGAEWGSLHGPTSRANERDVIHSKCDSDAADPQRELYLPACYLPYYFQLKLFSCKP